MLDKHKVLLVIVLRVPPHLTMEEKHFGVSTLCRDGPLLGKEFSYTISQEM